MSVYNFPTSRFTHLCSMVPPALLLARCQVRSLTVWMVRSVLLLHVGW